MPSFTSEVKAEIVMNELKPCCAKAQLAALVQTDATLSISNQTLKLNFQSDNPTTAKRFWILLKQTYQATPSLQIFKRIKLKKNHSYVVSIDRDVKTILEDMHLLTAKGFSETVARSVVSKECCARAYLAGAFLASGSINSPINSNYHCEIALSQEKLAIFVQKLCQRFDLNAKVIVRRHHHVVYIKAADQISDFLRMIGAFQSLMKFEDIRIQRDFTNSLTRLDNCEVANEMKVIASSNEHIIAIELLIKYDKFEKLDNKLKEVAILRQLHPEASLNELAQLYTQQNGALMSKSGMKHRFNKIIELSKPLKEKEVK